MRFGPQHYVPVLKVKRGEKDALQRIHPALRARITPLMEIVERKGETTLGSHIATAFRGLAGCLQSYGHCFLDARHLEPAGPLAAQLVFERAVSEGIAFVPVTGISRADVPAVLQHRARGLALRLTRAEFEAGHLQSRIESFLSQHALEPPETDLIIDLGPVEQMIAPGISAFTELFMQAVPHHQHWRTFTVSACAFPLSMAGVERHSHDFVDRGEWMAWRNGLHARRSTIERLPTFSDCAIQHPSGVEGFNPQFMQVSAAIRYTLPEQWLLIKGESTRSVLPSQQFPELATRLVYGHLQSYFAGAGHCTGCRWMKDAADGRPGYGSAEAWRKLGTIHHISTVMHGLDSLTWS
jgi:hypothetical protein